MKSHNYSSCVWLDDSVKTSETQVVVRRQEIVFCCNGDQLMLQHHTTAPANTAALAVAYMGRVDRPHSDYTRSAMPVVTFIILISL